MATSQPTTVIADDTEEVASSRYTHVVDSDELDPSLFPPPKQTHKLTRQTKSEIVSMVERMGIDVADLRTAINDPKTTLQAQHAVLSFVKERDRLMQDLDVMGNSFATQEFRDNRKNYHPVPADQVQRIASSLTDPRIVKTSDGMFVIDMASIHSFRLSQQRMDIEDRIVDRVQHFKAEIATLRN